MIEILMTVRESRSLYIISPHQDDAAFSLALTIARLSKSGATITIVNCFTVSEYQPLGGPLPVADVSYSRHQEDLRFISNIPGVLLKDLNFHDAPLRLGISPAEVCLSVPDSPSITLDPAAGKLKHAFLSLPAPEIIFVPLAIGGHIDHLLVRNEALAAFRAKRIVFYQDLPYVNRFPDGDLEIAAILSGLHLQCKPLTFVTNRHSEEKYSYISAYNSQASEDELNTIANYPGGERLWVTPEAWSSFIAFSQSAAPSL